MGCSQSTHHSQNVEPEEAANAQKNADKNELLSWSYNILDLKLEEVTKTIYDVFEYVSASEALTIPVDKLTSFVGVVQSNYHQNP